MRPPNGSLAQVAALLRLSRATNDGLARIVAPLQLSHALRDAPASKTPPYRGPTRNRGEVEDGPQYLNKSPLMFICKGHTIDNVEAGAGNPVCSARLA